MRTHRFLGVFAVFRRAFVSLLSPALLGLFVLPFAGKAAVQSLQVSEIDSQTIITVVSDKNTPPKLLELENPPRIVLDYPKQSLGFSPGAIPPKGALQSVRSGSYHGKLRIVLEVLPYHKLETHKAAQGGGHQFTLVVYHGAQRTKTTRRPPLPARFRILPPNRMIW